jgi:hypothetical protein
MSALRMNMLFLLLAFICTAFYFVFLPAQVVAATLSNSTFCAGH